jgi:hypothetical protein
MLLGMGSRAERVKPQPASRLPATEYPSVLRKAATLPASIDLRPHGGHAVAMPHGLHALFGYVFEGAPSEVPNGYPKLPHPVSSC